MRPEKGNTIFIRKTTQKSFTNASPPWPQRLRPVTADKFDSRGLAFEGVATRVPFDPSRGSKCFSCEAQDAAMGITRDYGSKCIDCENQDRAMGVFRGYGSKWY